MATATRYALMIDTVTNHRFNRACSPPAGGRAVKPCTRPRATVSAALLDCGYPTLVAILAQAGAISLLLIVASIWFLRSPGQAGRWRVALYILPISVAAVPPERRLQAAHRRPNLARLPQKRERKAHLGPSLLAPSDLVSGPSEPSLLAQQKLPAPGRQDLDSAAESVLARAVSTRGPGFHPCSQGGQTGYKGGMLLIDSHHGPAA